MSIEQKVESVHLVNLKSTLFHRINEGWIVKYITDDGAHEKIILFERHLLEAPDFPRTNLFNGDHTNGTK